MMRILQQSDVHYDVIMNDVIFNIGESWTAVILQTSCSYIVYNQELNNVKIIVKISLFPSLIFHFLNQESFV